MFLFGGMLSISVPLASPALTVTWNCRFAVAPCATGTGLDTVPLLNVPAVIRAKPGT